MHDLVASQRPVGTSWLILITREPREVTTLTGKYSRYLLIRLPAQPAIEAIAAFPDHTNYERTNARRYALTTPFTRRQFKG
jgi:hypothetical protein